MSKVEDKYRELFATLSEEDRLCMLEDGPYWFQYMTNPTYAECALAVSLLGSMLEFVEHQTEMMCMAAVESMPHSIQYVRNQTRQLCVRALELDATVIRHIRKPTSELISLSAELLVKQRKAE